MKNIKNLTDSEIVDLAIENQIMYGMQPVHGDMGICLDSEKRFAPVEHEGGWRGGCAIGLLALGTVLPKNEEYVLEALGLTQNEGCYLADGFNISIKPTCVEYKERDIRRHENRWYKIGKRIAERAMGVMKP